MLNNRRALRFAAVLVGAAHFLGFSSAALAADSWSLVRDRDGIQIFSREVPGSALRAVRGVGRIKAPVTEVVALLRDVPARPTWDATCASATVLRKTDRDEEMVYIHSQLPWPVADREMVLRTSWSFDKEAATATLSSVVVRGGRAVTEGRVQVQEGYNIWTVRQIAAGEAEVITEVHLDPGGRLPGWLLNYLADEAPFDILRRMREILESGKYADSLASGSGGGRSIVK